MRKALFICSFLMLVATLMATAQTVPSSLPANTQAVTTAVVAASTQQASEPDMASALRSNGKIYVVVLVLATIFAGIIVFLVRLDRKISKLEQAN
jgi:hypothetical protein